MYSQPHIKAINGNLVPELNSEPYPEYTFGSGSKYSSTQQFETEERQVLGFALRPIYLQVVPEPRRKRGCAGLRACMVAVKKRKSQPARNRTPITRSSPQSLY